MCEARCLTGLRTGFNNPVGMAPLPHTLAKQPVPRGPWRGVQHPAEPRLVVGGLQRAHVRRDRARKRRHAAALYPVAALQHRHHPPRAAPVGHRRAVKFVPENAKANAWRGARLCWPCQQIQDAVLPPTQPVTSAAYKNEGGTSCSRLDDLVGQPLKVALLDADVAEVHVVLAVRVKAG